MRQLCDLLDEAAFPGNTHAFEEAKKRLTGENLVVLVGSGASIPIFPSWIDLLKRFFDEAEQEGKFQDPNEGEIYRNMINEDILEAASSLESLYGRPVFRGKLNEIFSGKEALYTDVHKKIIALGVTSIVTTNFDCCIEAAYAEECRRVAHSLDLQSGFTLDKWVRGESSRNPTVAHIHGVPSNPDGLIFTKEDYLSFYKSEGARKILEKIWDRDRLLVVGFGFSDPFLIHGAENILRLKIGGQRHFAIVGVRKDKMTSIQRDLFMKKYRLSPIFYRVKDNLIDGAHSDLHLILKSLSSNDESNKDKSTKQPSICVGTPHVVPGHQDSDRFSDMERDFEKGLFTSTSGVTLFIEPRLLLPEDIDDLSVKDHRKSVPIEYIVSSDRSFLITAKPEYGGTTLCRKLRLEFSRLNKQVVLQDAEELPTYKKKLQVMFNEIATDGGSTIILDNFVLKRDERLLKELSSLGLFNKFILVSKQQEIRVGYRLPPELEAYDFQELELSYLSRTSVRSAVTIVFQTADKDYVSFIVDKIYKDLMELCIPLTPGNVIMYIRVIHSEGDFYPLNRVQIVDKYIRDTLRRPSDAYAESFGSRNKIELLSFVSFTLFKSRLNSFSLREWEDYCESYKRKKLIAFDSQNVIKDLMRARIIVRSDDLYIFKYRLFFLYFVGHYINSNPELLKTLIEDGSHLTVSGLVEVVTGISSDNRFIVEHITSELEKALQAFSDEYIDGAFDPFIDMIWPRGPEEAVRLWAPLEKEIAQGPKNAEEIDDLKSSFLAERQSEKQHISYSKFEELEDKLVALYLELVNALKNSDNLDGELKVRALKAIIRAYKILFQVGLMLIPALLQARAIYWFGVLFINRVEFSATDTEVDKKIRMMIAILRAGSSKSADNLGIKKLAEVFAVYESQHAPKGIERVMVFSATIRAKEKNWEARAKKLIETTPRKAFYLREMLESIKKEYFEEICTAAQRSELERLIAYIKAKRELNKDDPGKKVTEKMLRLLGMKGYFKDNTPFDALGNILDSKDIEDKSEGK